MRRTIGKAVAGSGIVWCVALLGACGGDDHGRSERDIAGDATGEVSGSDVAEEAAPPEDTAALEETGPEAAEEIVEDTGPSTPADTVEDTGPETVEDTAEAGCATGAEACDGVTPKTCVDGAWVLRSEPCAGKVPVCLDGSCVACMPDAVGCGANTPRTCDANGQWQYGAVCAGASPLCVDGACRCTPPGNTQCNGATVETCEDDGRWVQTEGCLYTCVNAACTGSCVPGSVRCNGAVPQACDGNGVWQSSPACTGAAALCLAGTCVACNPGDVRCSGNAVQTCSEVGAWGAATPCVESACVAGQCEGSCVPGATRCTGLVPETCQSDGTWLGGAPCPDVCAAGHCIGVCVPETKTCFGAAPATCDLAGAWQADGGACQQPTPDCSAGQCACLEAMCDGVCTNTQTNPEHCGACGRSCQDGNCVAGVCQPYFLAIAAGYLNGVAVDDTSVYFGNATGGTLNKVPKSGGPTVALATNLTAVGAIAVSGASAYFLTFSTVSKVPTTPGGAVTNLAVGLSPKYLALDDANVYVTGVVAGAYAVAAVPKDGGALTVLANNGVSLPVGIAVDATNVYFANAGGGVDGGTVMKIAKDGSAGGVATTLAGGMTAPLWVVVDAGYVYWSYGGGLNTSLVRCAIGGCDGKPTMIATGQLPGGVVYYQQEIAVDDQYLYWTTYSAGNVMKALKDGSGAATIIVHAPNNGAPQTLAADADALYWVNYNQSGYDQILKIAK